MRDLLVTLGHERATLVGHSLGGGIAMQFAYQFPEMTERLVLVSSGGLGTEVSSILRAAALPGANLFIRATAGFGSRVGSTLGRGLAVVGLRPTADIAEIARGYASLVDPEPPRRVPCDAARRGRHRRTARLGQRSALPRGGIPVLLVWGERDPLIPVQHGRDAHAAIIGSTLEVFEGVGHLPQLEAPGRFIAALERFLDENKPSRFNSKQWRGRLRVSPRP